MGFTTGVLMLIGLVVQHFLAKYLTIDEYGIYALMFSWIALLSIFSLNSFNTIVTKAAAQKYPRFFKTASKICFLFSLIGSIVFLIIGFYFQPDLKSFFIIIAIFFPFYGGINLAEAFFIGSAKFEKWSLFVIISQIIIGIAQILSVYLFKDVSMLLFYTLLSTSLINLIITLYLFSKIKQETDKKKDKELTKYGIELTFITLIGSISTRVQYIILATLTNASTLAIYAVAQIIPERIKTVFKSSLNPLSIHLASINKEESIKILKKSLLLLILIGIIINISIALLLPPTILLIFGQKYVSSIIYSLALSSLIFLIPFNALFDSIVIYHGYKKFYAKLTIFLNVTQIILFFLLIPKFQIWGIIFSMLSLNFIATIIHLIWMFKIPKLKNKKTMLVFYKKNVLKGYRSVLIKSKVTGDNIIRIIEADYLSSKEKYPIWIKILTKMVGTKTLME